MRSNRNNVTCGSGLRRLTAALLVGLCLTATAGCSSEVYDPSAGSLSIEEGSGRWEIPTEAPTGQILEIPAGDPFANAPQVLRADFLNTGKSDAILLRLREGLSESVILVDTGDADDYDTIRERLTAYGISEIDYLIISHFDKDHIGSASRILQDYTVKTVYMPDYVRDSTLYRRMMSTLEVLPAITVERLPAGREVAISLAGGWVRINSTDLYPAGLTLGSDDSHAAEENNYSLITTVEFGEISLLLAGDAEQDRLTEFLAATDGTDYDLVKIPHHGSYDKALGDLLRGSEGLRYCVVHADSTAEVEASLVTAMRSVGSAAYYTYDGSVTFATDGESMVMSQATSP